MKHAKRVILKSTPNTPYYETPQARTDVSTQSTLNTRARQAREHAKQVKYAKKTHQENISPVLRTPSTPFYEARQARTHKST